ncbi:Clp protease [Mycobacteroides saopaulense]|uniref:Clp protease n=2 Tax=Mycobacteroides saopaulense TaxID=1578165 RepID=A0A1X0JBA5_9MYCO|nr:Clp protease [Mycobacteroides saopaulense]OHU13816.1 Clp protease [Mycobacteroides saopaulense]ORB60162.1 Clp protease [Mycobacteroides saopaulense]
MYVEAEIGRVMFHLFNERSRQVIVIAQEEGRELQHNYLGAEHLLLGLVGEGTGLGARLLATAGVRYENGTRVVQQIAPPSQEAPTEKISFTPGAQRTLELAETASTSRRHTEICTGHLLLGLVDAADPVIIQIWERLNVDVLDLWDNVRAHLDENLGD